jgi:DtxR family Mn-dependent transcriptional regulator
MKNDTGLPSAAVEDYMRAIYKLTMDARAASTTALATAMDVSPAAATNMIKKLARMKLVRYSPYRGVALTPAGEKHALVIVRRHRLIELFLAEVLGLRWDEVHEEAHRLEHALSDNLEEHMASYLGNPTEDPHGDPIPTKEGTIAADESQSLCDRNSGALATIRRITDQDPAHLRYLQQIGLVPKATVQVIEAAPFEGPVRVRVGEKEYSLSRQLARHIRVRWHPSQVNHR